MCQMELAKYQRPAIQKTQRLTNFKLTRKREGVEKGRGYSRLREEGGLMKDRSTRRIEREDAYCVRIEIRMKEDRNERFG